MICGVQITVLGCSGGYPSSATGPTSGYLVRDSSAALWIDCGTGTFAELQRNIAPGDLNGVIITHRHADHCIDLVGLFIHLKYDTAVKALPVLSPPETRSLLEPFVGDGFGDTLAWEEVDEGDARTVAGFGLRFSRTQHPVPTVAVEVTGSDGTRVIYTSDTGPEWSVSAFAPGADLVISEATYNSQASGAAHHLTAAEAGAAARGAEARRLMITHLWPTLDPAVSLAEASAAFGADVQLAAPGTTVQV